MRKKSIVHYFVHTNFVLHRTRNTKLHYSAQYNTIQYFIYSTTIEDRIQSSELDFWQYVFLLRFSRVYEARYIHVKEDLMSW